MSKKVIVLLVLFMVSPIIAGFVFNRFPQLNNSTEAHETTLADVQKVVKQFHQNDFIVLRSTGCVFLILKPVSSENPVVSYSPLAFASSVEGFWLAGHPDTWDLAAFRPAKGIPQSDLWNTAAVRYVAQEPFTCKLE